MKTFHNPSYAKNILNKLEEEMIIDETDTVELVAGLNEKGCLLLTDEYLLYASINYKSPDKSIIFKRSYEDITINNIWQDKWVNIYYKDENETVSFKRLMINEKQTKEIKEIIFSKINCNSSKAVESTNVILVYGRCNNKKCTIKLEEDIITITLPKLFNLDTDVYKVNIIDIMIYKNKSSSNFTKGKLGVALLKDSKAKYLDIEYDKKYQYQVNKIYEEFIRYWTFMSLWNLY